MVRSLPNPPDSPGVAGLKQYSGALDCAKKLSAAEGPGALFKGLPPALVRLVIRPLPVGQCVGSAYARTQTHGGVAVTVRCRASVMWAMFTG